MAGTTEVPSAEVRQDEREDKYVPTVLLNAA